MYVANIENVLIEEKYGYYDIHVEFSDKPVESFRTRQQAYDFLNGYLYGFSKNDENKRGKLYKELVEADIKKGITYTKKKDLDDLRDKIYVKSAM